MKGLPGLVVDSLAAYRVARLVVSEDSPLSQRVRTAITGHAPAGWAAAVDCEHCTGLWAALALGVLRGVPGARALAYPLAVGGLQSLIATATAAAGPGDDDEPQGPVLATAAPPPAAPPPPGLVDLVPRA